MSNNALVVAGGEIGANALGRGAAVALMATSRPARSEGLGAAHVASLRRGAAVLGIVAGCAITIVALRWSGLAATVLAAVIALGVRAVALRRWGGVTGDVLGATEQLVETGVFVVASMAGT